MERSQILGAIGPVTSHWGMKTWRLLFLKDQAVAWHYTWVEAFKVGMAHRGFSCPETVPNFAKMAHRNAEQNGNVRRHLRSDIAKITLRSKMSRNVIEFLDNQGSLFKYGILIRDRTDEYSELLRKIYGKIFSEEEFPQNRLGRFLKS